MEIEDIIEYAATLPYMEEEYKESWGALLLKVGGKMFALMAIEGITEPAVNLKCDPERAEELRMHYPGIEPGYHMNKRHWNTVFLRRHVPDELVREMVRHSYALVYAKLPKKIKEELKLPEGF